MSIHVCVYDSLINMGVIVNYRKQLGLGPTYFGNAVASRTLVGKVRQMSLCIDTYDDHGCVFRLT